MSGWFWLIFLIPLAWPFIAKTIWTHKITPVEMGLNSVVVLLVVSAVWFMGRYSATSDIEIWNGQVTAKKKVSVSCEHSYSCNCYTTCSGSGSSKSCSETCSTCYDHSNDWDWRVYTNVGEFNINRVDRRGSNKPPRWTKVIKGQPVARKSSYTNWVKAVPESLFHDNAGLAEKYKASIPEYPLNVFDYHHLNRFLTVGLEVSAAEQKAWNESLSEELIWIGPNKQANIVIIAAGIQDPNYAYAVKRAWLGGKKNDIVIIVGVDQWPNIVWSHVFSWSKADLINVKLRDDILAMKTMKVDNFMEVMRNDIFADYIRRPMAEFEYLKEEIEPPMWVIILGLLFGSVGSVLLSLFFMRDDVNIGGSRSRWAGGPRWANPKKKKW